MIKIDLPEDADENTYHYRLESWARLILDTQHGTVIIDVRPNDVNAFTIDGGRKAYLLLKRP